MDGVKKLTVLEIRQDSELIRINNLIRDLQEQSRQRTLHLYKENDIKPVEFVGGLFDCNSSLPH